MGMLLRLFVVFFVITTAWGRTTKLDINISINNNFTISLSGQEWFRSGPIEVRNKGVWLSSANGSLVLAERYNSSGVDILGAYNYFYFEYHSKPGWFQSLFRFTTFAKIYEDIDAVVFGHTFVSGAEDAATDSEDNVISSFPSILVEDSPLERGYLTYERDMAVVVDVGQWNSKSDITTGFDGGLPLTVFDKAMENTIVISPFTEFMATSSHLDTSSDPRVLQLGVFGKADQIPVNYSVEFIMVAGDKVTGTLQQWGQMLRIYYGKDDKYRKSDFSINYLGYWTDDGACYYDFIDSVYEKTLVAVKEQADKDGIPYRYVQMDSWWYYEATLGGVKTWEAKPSVFPDGVAGFSNKTGWPVVAQNTFWSSETIYAKQNGGQFDFIVEPGISLPNDPLFWDFLFAKSVTEEWNLIVYEQDDMRVEEYALAALQSNVSLGRSWLMDMGNAAMKYGMTIQYSDPWTRHIMQSVEIPAVTQTKVSAGYLPGGDEWIIGDTIILAHALGLAGFKDTFHTIEEEKDCTVYFKNLEFYAELEATAAAFSGGPVGPSDQYNLYNKTLIMATCMEDGLLLKPTYPAMSLDSTFTQRAFGEGGPKGQLWAGYTAYKQSMIWYFILAAIITEEYSLTTTELPMIGESSLAYQSLIGNGKVTHINYFDISNPLTVPVCGRKDFQTWTIAPVTTETSWVLLGETSKFVKMSEQRVSDIMVTGGYLIVQLHGSPLEVVTMAAIDTANDITIENIKYFQCTIPDDGKITLHIPTGCVN